MFRSVGVCMYVHVYKYGCIYKGMSVCVFAFGRVWPSGVSILYYFMYRCDL